ncbi:T9SS type A sorting domain-containing protein [Psychroflexus sp. CAK8W]|uniref:T9SS type A sorting domain-containing protein n=1 Tax=Psychroflexus longus TaxID=2873596 RepID=A0ABS7XEH2_9FLAO|nr:T9SS type A sorting domain-containing protein [Psychroflexus longus]MBZ9777338.1 T9SS type A sorting domain-containing protein [Psychroflexus longus]
MKTTLLKSSLVLLFLMFGFNGYCQIISQYVDTDSGTFPKGIEIWNNTGAVLDFTTSNLIIQQGTNGAAPTAAVTINTGTLAVNEVLIIGTSDMQVAADANSVRFVLNSFTFNGNDALVVQYNGITTDVFGSPGTDPGSSWSGKGVSTADQNIRLKEGITTGDTGGFTDPSTRFETVNTDPSGVNGLEGFGIAPVGTSDPSLKASVVSLSGFVYPENDGPSVSQEFSITGNNLDGTDVIIQLPTGSDFEISQTQNGTYSDQIIFPGYNGSASSIYVRLKQGLIVSNYTDVLEILGGGSYTTGVYLDGSVLGDAFILYEFTDDSPNPTYSPGNATLSNFGISENSLIYGTTGTWSGSGIPYAQGNTGWGAMSPDVAKNFFFTLKPDTGFRANLTNISFEWKVTGNGPSAITVEVNGTEVETFNAADNNPIIFSASLTGFDNLSEVIVRIKGWDNGSRSTTGGGQFRIDDVKIDGEIISKPFDYIYENGAWSPETPINISTDQDDILIVNGNLTLNQNLTSNDFQVLSEATVEITSTNTLNVTGNLSVNGNLTFKSDAAGSAQLLHSTTSNIIGDITVERFIPAKRAFRLLSSPVGGQSFVNSWQKNTHITGVGGIANGFDPTSTNNPSLFVYDNQIENPSNGEAWEAVTSAYGELEAGKPYRIMVRGDRGVDLTNNEAGPSNTTLVSKGNMLSGDLSTGVQLPALSPTADNFSFVANPYQAVVDFSQVVRTDLIDEIYVWEVGLGSESGKGGYVTVALDGSAPDPSSSEASKFLIPGQAFFVKNNSSANSPSLTFSPNAIVSSETQPQILSTSELAYVNIRLYKTQDFVNGSMEADAVGLRFSNEFTTSPSDEDAYKLINPGENMVIFNEKILSIDKRKFPENDEKIQLAMANFKQNEYTLAFYSDYLPEDKKLILIDNYLQEEVEVTDDFSYNFTVDSSMEGSDDQTRFQLMLNPVTLAQDEFNLVNSVRLYPNPASDILNLDVSGDSSISEVELFSMLGQKMNSDFITTDKGIQLDVSALNTGLYLVKIKTENGITTRRFIKN